MSLKTSNVLLQTYVIFSFILGDDFPNRKFSIESETGVIQTTAFSLDRELEDLYELTVAVSDRGNPARTVR